MVWGPLLSMVRSSIVQNNPAVLADSDRTFLVVDVPRQGGEPLGGQHEVAGPPQQVDEQQLLVDSMRCKRLISFASLLKQAKRGAAALRGNIAELIGAEARRVVIAHPCGA
jgi:hypothetical protein